MKDQHEQIRIVAFWVALIGGSILTISLFSFFIFQLFKENSWIIEIYKNHFVAGIGLPFAAIAAFIIVIVFKHQDGDVEVKMLGFEFKGASGQIMMWVIVFLSEALALKFLW